MIFNYANGHVVRFGDRAMRFHVPTTALFELDELGAAVVDIAQRSAQRDVAAFIDALEGRFESHQVRDFVDRLAQLEVLQGDGTARPVNPRRVDVESYPLSTIVLNVNTGCNLGCTYCYKEDLQIPSRGERMNFATASRSVDLLLAQAAQRDRIGIVFFGGEPLTNMPLIREVVDYAERTCDEAGKRVDFSLTTNATLLTPEIIEFFDAHRFGISVSMD